MNGDLEHTWKSRWTYDLNRHFLATQTSEDKVVRKHIYYPVMTSCFVGISDFYFQNAASMSPWRKRRE